MDRISLQDILNDETEWAFIEAKKFIKEFCEITNIGKTMTVNELEILRNSLIIKLEENYNESFNLGYKSGVDDERLDVEKLKKALQKATQETRDICLHHAVVKSNVLMPNIKLLKEFGIEIK